MELLLIALIDSALNGCDLLKACFVNNREGVKLQ